MKKLSLLLLLFFGLAPSLFAQEPTASECKQLHTGTYYVKSMPNVVVVRDENTQTETDTKTGKYVKLSITWTDDCTYQLRYLSTNYRGKEKKMHKNFGTLTVVVTSVNADGSYQFSASSPSMTQPLRGTIMKK